jgi:hypothetical protein
MPHDLGGFWLHQERLSFGEDIGIITHFESWLKQGEDDVGKV